MIRIPSEILYIIVSNVKAPKEILKLTRVNKALRHSCLRMPSWKNNIIFVIHTTSKYELNTIQQIKNDKIQSRNISKFSSVKNSNIKLDEFLFVFEDILSKVNHLKLTDIDFNQVLFNRIFQIIPVKFLDLSKTSVTDIMLSSLINKNLDVLTSLNVSSCPGIFGYFLYGASSLKNLNISNCINLDFSCLDSFIESYGYQLDSLTLKCSSFTLMQISFILDRIASKQKVLSYLDLSSNL